MLDEETVHAYSFVRSGNDLLCDFGPNVYVYDCTGFNPILVSFPIFLNEPVSFTTADPMTAVKDLKFYLSEIDHSERENRVFLSDRLCILPEIDYPERDDVDAGSWVTR